jgi:hypothetical protein
MPIDAVREAEKEQTRIARHKTAMRRFALSRPLALAFSTMAAGGELISGCSRRPESLQAAGIPTFAQKES